MKYTAGSRAGIKGAEDCILEKSIREVCRELFTRTGYYLRWYHDEPLFVSREREKETERLHAILYKTICFMAEHYKEYTDRYMPLTRKTMEILDYQSRYPFRAGAWRPDFILAENGDIKLCEITSRFFAHGIWTSWYPECAADRFMEKHPGADRRSSFEEMLLYMKDLPGDKDRIFVLRSTDRTNEIELYQAFYEYYGRKVVILNADEVEPRIDEWRDAFVISALNQKDLLSYSMDTLKAMVDAGMVNDFRTIFLIHDKRFMRLWFKDDFTGRFLTDEETAFLRERSIETFVCGEKESSEVMKDAYQHKDRYILKHYCLGKSERVYAGPLTDEKAWRALWVNGSIHEMVLQPFIKQKYYPVVWEGTAFNDYVSVMLLCVNDRFFGCGMVRSSSLPVTNVGDDRKISCVYTDCEEIINRERLL